MHNEYIQNYDYYSDNVQPNGNVNPHHKGALWNTNNHQQLKCCIDANLDRNKWVRLNPEIDRISTEIDRISAEGSRLKETIKEVTKFKSDYGDFSGVITAPEYDFDLNVKRDFDWVCPPDVYPMFRYGKYLIAPMECDYRSEQFIGDDRKYNIDNGVMMVTYNCYNPSDSYYLPGNPNIRYPRVQGEYNCIPAFGFDCTNIAVYPNRYGNMISHFPAVSANEDLISRILSRHYHYKRWARDRNSTFMMTRLIDDNQNRTDLRRGVDFSLLKRINNSSDAQYSFIAIYPRRDVFSSHFVVMATQPTRVPCGITTRNLNGDKREIYRGYFKNEDYAADLYGHNKGICLYLAIRVYR